MFSRDSDNMASEWSHLSDDVELMLDPCDDEIWSSERLFRIDAEFIELLHQVSGTKKIYLFQGEEMGGVNIEPCVAQVGGQVV